MILPHELAGELRILVDQFERDPINPRFKDRMSFGPDGRYSVMIWSPIEMYELNGVICPLHNSLIASSMITSEFEKKDSKRNPRLITALTRNIVLIQRIYRCPVDGHDLYSSSDDVVQSLPDKVKMRMGFKIYHRSAFNLEVIDYIFNQITKGNNFTQVAESLADFHLSDYLRHGGCEDDFYTDELTRYPSHDKVCY